MIKVIETANAQGNMPKNGISKAYSSLNEGIIVKTGLGENAEQRIQVKISRMNDVGRSMGSIEDEVLRLFPEIERRGQDCFNIVICASELISNATKEEKQLPASILYIRKGNLLRVETRQRTSFDEPKVALPENKNSTHGRGLYIISSICNGNLGFDGKAGIAWFEYEITGN